MFGGEKRRVFAASNALDCDSDLPDNPVRFVPENVARNQVTFGACVPASCRLGNGGARALQFDVDLRPSRGEHIWRYVNAVGHHDKMLHLCSAPCKALRFAPPARARGLRAWTVPARR